MLLYVVFYKFILLFSLITITFQTNSTLHIIGSDHESYEVEIKIPDRISVPNLKFIGKVCVQNTLLEIYKNCILKYNNYNKYWLIFVEDLKLLSDIVKFGEGLNIAKNEYQILVNNDTLISTEVILKDKPIFIADFIVYNAIKVYNVDYEKDNIHIGLTCIYIIKLDINPNFSIANSISFYMSIINISVSRYNY